MTITIEKACARWVEGFSCIPVSLIRQAYQNRPERLQRLSKRRIENSKTCWQWMFIPKERDDEYWIEYNIDRVEDCGFVVYYSNECGIILGINSEEFDYDRHWVPLFKARGLWRYTARKYVHAECDTDAGGRQNIPE